MGTNISNFGIFANHAAVEQANLNSGVERNLVANFFLFDEFLLNNLSHIAKVVLRAQKGFDV